MSRWRCRRDHGSTSVASAFHRRRFVGWVLRFAPTLPEHSHYRNLSICRLKQYPDVLTGDAMPKRWIHDSGGSKISDLEGEALSDLPPTLSPPPSHLLYLPQNQLEDLRERCKLHSGAGWSPAAKLGFIAFQTTSNPILHTAWRSFEAVIHRAGDV